VKTLLSWLIVLALLPGVRHLLSAIGFVQVFVEWMGFTGSDLAVAWRLTRLRENPLALAGGTDSEWATGSPAAVKRWSRDVWVELPKLIYFSKMMGEGLNNILQMKKELESQPGDKITFSFIRKLNGAGVTGDTDQEGAEEQVSSYEDDVTIDQVRNAIRLKGRMSERRTAFNQRTTGKELLTTWIAERVDSDIFAALDLNPSTSIYAGTATATNNLTATDYLTLALLTKAKTKAKKATPKLHPVKIGGKDYYVALIHPDQEHDLKVHDAAWAQAQREARERGDDNPLFEGSVGVWDNVIIHVHENVAISTTFGAGGNIAGAYSMFLGRQAGAFAWGERPRWVEKDFDYDNKVGFSIGAIYGVTKAVFNAVDHAMYSIRTARTNN
jgi:N4-gp56 family major capsid protein